MEENHAIIISGFTGLARCDETGECDLPGDGQLPKHELYGLSQQMRRAAVSIPSNIAEGKGHHSNKAFASFLLHARGSLLELQTQIEIAGDLQYLSESEVRRLLNGARPRWVEA